MGKGDPLGKETWGDMWIQGRMEECLKLFHASKGMKGIEVSRMEEEFNLGQGDVALDAV